ncbi:tRNA (adenosine(37)-N6)-dimethylallyltransferase MiaA [Sulfurospirillum sp.]|nr:tRNA (adenosine(37)-N6)-dimethylallyltransferase MiaA [Sulfurospirillum sp.]
MREIAILGPTASGKTSLSIELAKELNANILSLDSLSIYKEIDIASAKPTKQEREGIKHFGIDALHVDEDFSVIVFFELYKEAKKVSQQEGKNLIIVGGTGFYLKSMIDGVSYKPEISEATKLKVTQSLSQGYELMSELDEVYADVISKNDTYRIEKWLEIYFQTGAIPSQFFEQNQREPLIKDVEIYEITIEKEILRDRISKRTQIMLDDGLIDEVFYLESKYTRAPNPMKSIGIAEALNFLDGDLSKNELKEKIITNTARLAKRQKTFNASQFKAHFTGSVKEIKNFILSA